MGGKDEPWFNAVQCNLDQWFEFKRQLVNFQYQLMDPSEVVMGLGTPSMVSLSTLSRSGSQFPHSTRDVNNLIVLRRLLPPLAV